MSALETLSALAAEQDWENDVIGPDVWGDTRIAASSTRGVFRATFDPTGKLAGAYLCDRGGRKYRTERVSTAKQWLAWRLESVK